MDSKPVLNYQELILHIKSSGIIISDDIKALRILSQINYQRLMVYRLHFMKNGNITAGTKFEDIYDLYQFDRDIKACIYPLLESLEFCLRAKIAYYLGLHTGIHGYLEALNFKNTSYHQKTMEKFQETIIRERNNRNVLILHHESKYSDDLPIYKAVEIFSMGDLTKLYDNIREEIIKKNIMQDFVNRERNLNTKVFRSWIIRLTDIRNICAHYDILWSKGFELKPLKTIYWDNLVVNKVNNNRYYSFFTIMIIFKILTLNEKLYNEVLDKFEELMIKYQHVIKHQDIRFPVNWKNDIRNY